QVAARAARPLHHPALVSVQSITARCRRGRAVPTNPSLQTICLPPEAIPLTPSRSHRLESTHRAKRARRHPQSHSTFCLARSLQVSRRAQSSRLLPSIPHLPRTLPAATTVTTRPMVTRFPTPFL